MKGKEIDRIGKIFFAFVVGVFLLNWGGVINLGFSTSLPAVDKCLNGEVFIFGRCMLQSYLVLSILVILFLGMIFKKSIGRFCLGKRTPPILMILGIVLSGLLALGYTGFIEIYLGVIESYVLLLIFLLILLETYFERNKNKIAYYFQMSLGLIAGVMGMSGILGNPEAVKWIVDIFVPIKGWLFVLWTIALAGETFLKDWKK